MVVLIPNSKGVTPQELQQWRKYIIATLDSYTISPNDARVSIVTYGGNARQILQFKDGISTKAIEYYLNTISINEEENDLTSALEFVHSDVFTSLTGSRDYSKKIVLIFANEKVTFFVSFVY